MAYSYYTAAALRPQYTDTGGQQYQQYYESLAPAQGQKQGQSFNYGQAAGSALSGIAAGSAYTTPKGSFETDRLAALYGSTAGLSSGGVIGAIAGGVTAGIGQGLEVEKNIENVSTDVKGFTTQGGKPTYLGRNLSAASGVVSDLEVAANPEWSWEFLLSPSAIGPAIYNKGDAREKQTKLRNRIQKEQTLYNTAYQDYVDRYIAEQDYRRRTDPNRRMTNLYNYG